MFAVEWDGTKSDDNVLVVIKMERGLWAWKRSDIVRGPDFRGMETERATTSTLTVGATAIAFHMGLIGISLVAGMLVGNVATSAIKHRRL